MGLLKGSLSLCRYKIVGGQALTEQQYNKKFLKYQAKPVSLGRSPKELIAGWVMPPGVFEDEEREGDYWDLSDCRTEGGYILRIRLEKRKIPSELFQIMLRQKFQDYLSQHGKKPPRNEQQLIREEVRSDLIGQALPTISYLDACWKDDGSVLLFNTAKKSREVFEELFKVTVTKPMKAGLISVEPPLMALSREQWGKPELAKPNLDQLDKLLPSWILTGHA